MASISDTGRRLARALLLGALVLLVGVASAHADVYQCKDASGAVAYQQSPCAQTAQQRTIERPTAAASQAISSGDALVMKIRVAGMLGLKRYCDNTQPDLAKEVSFDWSRWRVNNLVVIREVESDPTFIEAARQQPADGYVGYTREDSRFVCAADWIHDFFSAFESDGKLPFAASPESNWQHFISALSRADRREALRSYSLESRPKYGAALEALTDDQLKQQAATWKLKGSSMSSPSSREYFVQTGNKQAGTVWFYLFNRNWLIVEM